KVYMVAHSMGGLVSRSFINQLVATGETDFLKLFVTMSTPWGGHQAAERATGSMPLAPSWVKMRPSSTFIHTLFTHPLPDDLPYCMLFSYAGGNFLIRGANDGPVTLASQLRYEAQDAAEGVFGLDENHDSILTNKRSSELLNRILRDGGCPR